MSMNSAATAGDTGTGYSITTPDWLRASNAESALQFAIDDLRRANARCATLLAENTRIRADHRRIEARNAVLTARLIEAEQKAGR